MLRDILLDWILFNIPEMVVISLFIINQKRVVMKLKYWVCILIGSMLYSGIYYINSVFNIPLLNQLSVSIIILMICCLNFHIDLYVAVVRLVLIYGIIMICETIIVMIIMEVFDMDFAQLSTLIKFLWLLPTKILEIIIILKEEFWMKVFWGSIERR